MSVSAIFWLFLMLVAIAPMIRQRMLEAGRLKLLQRLEAKRKSRVIALIHRQETMSLLGFPIFRYIDIQDSEEVIRAIRMTDQDIPIDLILHTPGGLVLAAEQIAHALKNRTSKVTVFVPHYAMSGGTLLALAADEIVMDPNAVLGPVDPQVGDYPAVSLLRMVEQKDKNKIDDRTLILADVARKAAKQVADCVRKLADKHLAPEEAEKLAAAFTEGRWTHDYPIVYEEAQRLGLPVSQDVPQEVYQLMNLYPQPVKRRSIVEYVPMPYGDRSHPRRRGTKW